MYDKMLAIFALASFAAFLAVLGIWVESTALRVVLGVTVLLAAFDFWRTPSSSDDKTSH